MQTVWGIVCILVSKTGVGGREDPVRRRSGGLPIHRELDGESFPSRLRSSVCRPGDHHRKCPKLVNLWPIMF